MTKFDDRIKEADNERRAAAETLADLLDRGGHSNIAQELRSGADVHIENIARAIYNTDDNGLQSAMRKSVERYVNAYNEQMENEVKKDIFDDMKYDLDYYLNEFNK